MLKEQKIIKARAYDIDQMYLLFATVNELDLTADILKDRIDCVKYGRRNIGLLKTVSKNLAKDLMQTFQPEKRRTLVRMSHMTHYKAVPKVQASKPKEDAFIDEDDLAVLVDCAMDRCRICIDGNCKRCTLGKVFDRNLKFDIEPGENWCQKFTAAVNGGAHV